LRRPSDGTDRRRPARWRSAVAVAVADGAVADDGAVVAGDCGDVGRAPPTTVGRGDADGLRPWSPEARACNRTSETCSGGPRVDFQLWPCSVRPPN